MPLILILAECGIELIPKKLRNHPAIRKNLNSRNYASQLLDNALHHTAMKKLKNYQKRGRPDVAHLCLLNALGSPLNKAGLLKVYLHTTRNKIYFFNPEIRITRNFNRFKGLMAKLLIDNIIGPENSPLISSFRGSLKDLIDSFEEPEVILFSSRENLVKNAETLFSKGSEKNYVILIGGFQKSRLSERVRGLSERKISISNYSLDAWVAVYKALCAFENANDIV
ncbi:MAG: 16S rRNA methyltransferase [Promethearchaeota archaeon]|nr:MAG: 16S rRNA methyltransferase [Candidatus Lokiarchaeota archaeon]